ncbi:DNA pol B 2 domain-containing protein, partial [Aphis craccivora]
MALVTRKGVYDNWSRLDEDRLPRKEDFYSALKETDNEEEDYDHAVDVWRNLWLCDTRRVFRFIPENLCTVTRRRLRDL